MKTINGEIENTLIIKNSKFITKIIHVEHQEELENILNVLKEKYKNATHYCYGYMINNIKHYNDDGEPGGTAGLPIVDVLEKNKLNNVIAVVIRYFGGIKLGAGGLIRAYRKSVTEAIKLAEIEEIIKYYKIIIEFDYDKIKLIDDITKNLKIVNKTFDDKIKYQILLKENELNIIETFKRENINIMEEKN